MSDKNYLNPQTGMIDTLKGWLPKTPEDFHLVEVVWDEEKGAWTPLVDTTATVVA